MFAMQCITTAMVHILFAYHFEASLFTSSPPFLRSEPRVLLTKFNWLKHKRLCLDDALPTLGLAAARCSSRS